MLRHITSYYVISSDPKVRDYEDHKRLNVHKSKDDKPQVPRKHRPVSTAFQTVEGKGRFNENQN